MPAELAALVAKMMAKDPARRFQTPGEVAQALTPFFKKGNVAFKAPRVEISQAGQTGSGQPVRDRAWPVEPPKKAAEPTVPEPPWQSLIDSRETEHPKAKTPAAARSRRPPWLWPAVAVGVLVLGLVAWGVTLRVKTPDGIIELVNLPNDAEVLIDAREVTVTLPGGGKPAVITVPAGKRKIKVKKDGYKVSGEEVTVPAGGKVAFTVRLIPIADSRPAKIDADDRTSPSAAAKPQAAPANREVATELPTPDSIRGANQGTTPRIAERGKPETSDAPDHGANQPVRLRAMDAAEAMKGNVEVLSGRWLVEGKELVQTDADRGEVLFGDLRWTDYDFTVELMREGENGVGDTQLFFRRTLRNGNTLGFEVGGDGMFASDDGKWRGLGAVNPHLVDHKWYRARVIVRRSHIVCTLHDDQRNELVNLEADDDRHPSGQVGLGTEGSSWRFKNIKVTAPDGQTLWEMPPAIGEQPKPPVNREAVTTTPTSPQVPAANSSTNPTVAVDNKYEKVDAAGRVANQPAQPRAMDAAHVLKGKAEFYGGRWLVEGRQLVQTEAAEGRIGRMLFGDLRWTDYDFTVELMREKGNGATELFFHRTLRNDNHIEFSFGTAAGEEADVVGFDAIEDGKVHGLGEVEFRLVDHKWYRASCQHSPQPHRLHDPR